MTKVPLKAPFPYFGGKSRVASLIWDRLGDVDNFIEPFCGSAAVLLRRPTPPRIETINDADCMVANFWRATQHDPEAVAYYADSPVNEADLHARHKYLVLSPAAARFRRKMRSRPDYFNPKFAGWWAWGLCCWIGGGWCTAAELRNDGLPREKVPLLQNGSHPGKEQGKGVNAKIPAGTRRCKLTGSAPGSVENGTGVNAAGPQSRKANSNRKPSIDGGSNQYGHGVQAKGEQPHEWQQVPHMSDAGRGDAAPGIGPCEQLPYIAGLHGDVGRGMHNEGILQKQGNRPQLADAYDVGRGVNSQGDLGTCAARRAWLVEWFGRLRDRLRLVRVCCGDWRRVCDSESVTTRLGTTGIFFDPPYSAAAGRDMNLYAVECGKVAHDVRDYCLERGTDKRYRIALCGYESEGHEALEAAGWDVVAWETQGGYGNRSAKGKANAKKERIWFSPGCLTVPGLFDGLEAAAAG